MQFFLLYSIFLLSFFSFLSIPLSILQGNKNNILTKIYQTISYTQNNSIDNYVPQQKEQSQYFFHIPQNVNSQNKENYAQGTSHDIYSIDAQGNLINKATLPPFDNQGNFLLSKNSNFDEGILKFIDKGGIKYLSYPQKGDHFILYFKAGSNVHIFNQYFQYVTYKKLDYYLQSSHNGEYIMGISGDNSRLAFFNQNLDMLFHFDVNLLIDYQMDIDSNYVCFGTLSGEVIFVNVSTKNIIRNKNNAIIKSISCDFSNNTFAIHTLERTELKNFFKQYDSLIIGKIPMKYLEESKIDKKETQYANIDTYYKYSLENIIPYNIPVSITKNYILYITQKEKSIYANIANFKSKKEANIFNITFLFKNTAIDSIRSFSYKDSFVIYGENKLLIFNQYGLTNFFSFNLEILKVENFQHSIFIQTKNEIMIID